MSDSQHTLLDNKSSSLHFDLKPSYRDTLLAKATHDILASEYIYSFLDDKNNTQKLTRFRECRTGAYFYRNRETGKIRVGAQSCHLRFCPICQDFKTSVIKTNTENWLKSANFPKLLTFTLKHTDSPLPEQINKLYESFQKIRRATFFSDKCSGGVWFFEIKKSNTDSLWHPHIHCLIAGGYISQTQLKKRWFKITGDSNIVDIRLVKDKEKAARHVSRYAAKPASLKQLSLDDCIELAEALENRRICGTWGSCRKVKLTSLPNVDSSKWYRLAPWGTVIHASEFDDSAKEIIRAWRKGESLEAGINIDHLFKSEYESFVERERGSPGIDSQSYFTWSV